MGKEKVFRFKQFHVLNEGTAMKVNTDGVLLGAWCGSDAVTRVLDVGTGCGVIALMMAQRAPRARVDAIDVSREAVAVSRQNFAASPWASRLAALHADFNTFVPDAPYDLIVTNPPYFEGGVLPHDDDRAVARHGLSLSVETIVRRAATMLTPDGRLAMILPIEAETMLTQVCPRYGLSALRITRVSTVAGRRPKRILGEWGRRPAYCMNCSELAIEEFPGLFSDAYRALCSPFYLKM